MYFVAKIEEVIRLGTLISVMNEEPYELLSTLSNPKKPSEFKYSEAVLLMKNHLQPRGIYIEIEINCIQRLSLKTFLFDFERWMR